jgi:DNA polymerase elongation subunit (family B)
MKARARLLDLYADGDGLVLWFRLDSGGLLRLTDTFRYRFYADGPKQVLRGLVQKLGRYLRGTAWVRRREFWSGAVIPVLECTLSSPERLPAVQRLLAEEITRGLTFYNCDLAVPQYYAWGKGVFPFCRCDIEWEGTALKEVAVLDSPWDPDAPLPDLKRLRMELTEHPHIPLDRGNALRIESEGVSFELTASDLEDLLDQLNRLVAREDPDLILTTQGDARIFPFLWKWARQGRGPFAFDRDPTPPPRKQVGQGRSYFSYGRVLYQSTAFPLFGRLHVDEDNSFFYREAGLAGILFLSRLTRIPLQALARSSPGTAVTAMQIQRALEKDLLIPWKKGRPESFKSAWDLLVADKGGLVLQPPTGLWERVAEIDFVSMYPTIMVRHNISPETILCRCCPEPVVPEAGYNICRKRKGLIPETLEPILALRRELKSRKKAGHPEKDRYDGMQKALKWMLVTCFGYMGYKNARFGRIEAHEAITAFGREKLLAAKETAEEEGFQVLHGLTDSLWITGPHLTEENLGRLLDRITFRTGIPISLEGIYHWVVFLPSKVSPGRPVANRYFGLFQDGSVKIRGIDCCRSDTPPFIREVQKDLLLTLAEARTGKDLEERIPLLMDRLCSHLEALQEGRVDPCLLVIRKRVGRPLDDYHAHTPTVSVLEELEAKGITLFPGQRVGFLIKEHSEPFNSRTPVIPETFLQGNEAYDAAKYIDLTVRAAKEILSFYRNEINELFTKYHVKYNIKQKNIVKIDSKKSNLIF